MVLFAQKLNEERHQGQRQWSGFFSGILCMKLWKTQTQTTLEAIQQARASVKFIYQQLPMLVVVDHMQPQSTHKKT